MCWMYVCTYMCVGCTCVHTSVLDVCVYIHLCWMYVCRMYVCTYSFMLEIDVPLNVIFMSNIVALKISVGITSLGSAPPPP